MLEPFSRQVFGRTLEWWLREERPTWWAWGEDPFRLLAAASKQPVEKWIGPEASIPPAKALPELARALIADPSKQAPVTRVLPSLRIARALLCFRHALATWMGETVAQEFEQLTTLWATETRRLLLSLDDDDTDLVESCADHPDEPHEEVLLTLLIRALSLDPDIPESLSDAGPWNLLWLNLHQMASPHPDVLSEVGWGIGDPLATLRQAQAPLELLQSEWDALRFALTLTHGTSIETAPPDEAPKPDDEDDSDTLESLAKTVAEALTRLLPAPPDDDGEPLAWAETEAFFGLYQALGGFAALRDVGATARLPQAATPKAPTPPPRDTQEGPPPKPTAARALELARQGQSQEAFAHILSLLAVQQEFPWNEGLELGLALAEIAHARLDGVRPMLLVLRLHRLIGQPIAPNSPEGPIQEAEAMTRAAVEATGVFLDLLTKLFNPRPISPEQLDLAAIQLPITLRIEAIEAELQAVAAFGQPPEEGEGSPPDEPHAHLTYPRTLELAETLRESAGDIETSGMAWAALALWQLVIGEDHEFSHRQAVKGGAGATFDRDHQRAIRDGIKAPDGESL
jgi:hypothetical protein